MTNHKGTGYYTNPVEDAKMRFLHESRPLKRRIAYCRQRQKRVGSIKRREKWRNERLLALIELRDLQRRLIRGLHAH